ncbi:hypothetical protein BDV25DRAFT_163594 [Aspergillus avenaceus]|uniref:Uncharacterized protein n=1 Tax=Aspergillus avenaceus TaxID=36643 RepID=A0A5N6TIG2_ASPAV|nr:hypothetical protein BDV25DRAFT_163594 [Aspergillus avenaceus]
MIALSCVEVDHHKKKYTRHVCLLGRRLMNCVTAVFCLLCTMGEMMSAVCMLFLVSVNGYILGCVDDSIMIG